MKRHRAFTLVEVLIALAIFGLMATLLLQTIANVQTALNDMHDETLRAETKRFVLRRAMAATTAEAVQAGGNVTLADGESVAWSAMLETTELPDLHKLTLTFNWNDGTSDTMTFSAYRPEWSDATQRSSLQSSFGARYPQERLK